MRMSSVGTAAASPYDNPPPPRIRPDEQIIEQERH